MTNLRLLRLPHFQEKDTVDWKLSGVPCLLICEQVWELEDKVLIEKSSMLLVAALVRKKNDRPNVIKSLLTYQDSSENHSDLLQHVAACCSTIYYSTAPVCRRVHTIDWIWNMRPQWRCSNKQNGKEIQHGAWTGVDEWDCDTLWWGSSWRQITKWAKIDPIGGPTPNMPQCPAEESIQRGFTSDWEKAKKKRSWKGPLLHMGGDGRWW